MRRSYAPISSGLELFARGDLLYRGSNYSQPATTIRIDIPSITTIDARLGIQSADGRWGAYLWGRNLTDVEQLTRSLYLPLGPSNIMLRSPMIGRTYGLELRFNF